MSVTALHALALIEKDVNGDLITWSFPTLSAEKDKILKSRCGLDDKEYGPQFRFSRYAKSWQYMVWIPISSTQSKVTAVSVVLLTQDFHPEKYKALLAIFAKDYAANKFSPLPAMKGYLSVVTKKTFKTFKIASFDPRRPLISPVKNIIDMFQVEAIVIWVGMLLKKRVFVYCDKLSELLNVVRSFPLLGCWHRQNWNILRPYMRVEPNELKELDKLGVYVAGFTDSSAQGQTKYYDLYVDVSAGSYQIADHAKGDFMLTKFHKQTIEGFMKVCQEGNDQKVIKAIATKTKELLNNVAKLKTEHDDGTYITYDELAKRKLPPNMAKFLFNVAQAEGYCKK